MAQYQAHVKRLKEAIDVPTPAPFASEATNAESTDAAEVVANVEAQLVGEAASHAAAGPTEIPQPPSALFHAPVPNSTRFASATSSRYKHVIDKQTSLAYTCICGSRSTEQAALQQIMSSSAAGA